jgi:hypothetical protein
VIRQRVAETEEAGASESASEVKTGVKSGEKLRNHWVIVAGENGIRNSFGVADTPQAAYGFVTLDKESLSYETPLYPLPPQAAARSTSKIRKPGNRKASAPRIAVKPKPDRNQPPT